MTLTITPTDQYVEIKGAHQARVWEGRSEHGARCLVYIALIAVEPDADPTEFDTVLDPVQQPVIYEEPTDPRRN
jgi:hypothetical protein